MEFDLDSIYGIDFFVNLFSFVGLISIVCSLSRILANVWMKVKRVALDTEESKLRVEESHPILLEIRFGIVGVGAELQILGSLLGYLLPAIQDMAAEMAQQRLAIEALNLKLASVRAEVIKLGKIEGERAGKFSSVPCPDNSLEDAPSFDKIVADLAAEIETKINVGPSGSSGIDQVGADQNESAGQPGTAQMGSAEQIGGVTIDGNAPGEAGSIENDKLRK